MISYLFKSMWKSRRSNIFLITEIFSLCIVLFFGVLYGTRTLKPTLEPLGYTINDNMYAFSLRAKKEHITCSDLTDFVKQHKFVKQASISNSSLPHTESMSTSVFQDDSLDASFTFNILSADEYFASVMQLQLLKGKWFSVKETAPIPVVVTRNFEEKLKKDLIGFRTELFGKEVEIVGVLENYKRDEFLKSEPSIFLPYNMHSEPIYINLLVEFNGKPNEFTPTIQELNRGVKRNGWDVRNVASMTGIRKEWSQRKTAHLQQVLLMLVCLVILLALGLTGIFGYTTKRRAAELALYRSVGASKKMVQRQLLLEMLIIVTMGIIPAVLLLLQVPLLGIYTAIDEVLFSILISVLLIVIMVFTSTYFPSRQACNIEPGVALKGE